MSSYIVNITAKVDASVSEQWKIWVKDFFIPHLNAAVHAENIVFSRVLSMKDVDGDAFSIQTTVAGQQGVSRFEQQGMPEFIYMTQKEFVGQVVFFKTLMEIL